MKLTTKRRPQAALVERQRSGRWKVLAVVAGLVGGCYLFIAGDSGLLELSTQRRELRRLEEHVASLEAQNDSLRQVLWSLENDPDYVEKVAREQYGMIKRGERLYRIQPQPEATDGQ